MLNITLFLDLNRFALCTVFNAFFGAINLRQCYPALLLTNYYFNEIDVATRSFLLYGDVHLIVTCYLKKIQALDSVNPCCLEMKADKWACRSHTSPERCFCFHLKIQLWKFDSHFFIIIIIERVILNFMLTLIYTPSGWLRSGNVEFTTYSLYFGVNSHVVHVPHACVHQWSNVIDLNLAVIIIILLLIIPFMVCLGSPLQSSDSEHYKSLCCPYEEQCYFQATSTWYAFCMAWILSWFFFLDPYFLLLTQSCPILTHFLWTVSHS